MDNYLKYKSKYLKLKNMIGGGPPADISAKGPLYEDIWWQTHNQDLYYETTLPTLINRKAVTDFNNYIIKYTGNDSSKIIKDINRFLKFIQAIDNKDAIQLAKLITLDHLNKLSQLIKTDSFESDPVIHKPVLKNEYEILFIRHGISCANVLQHEDREDIISYKYFDPEITLSGIARCRELRRSLIAKINEIFKAEPYSLGASNTIRAKQTAYFMLSEETGIPINVIPHVCEKNFRAANIPLSQEEQTNILNNIDPKITQAIIRGKNAANQQNLFTKSDYLLFLDWAERHLDFFMKGSDGVYRAVIVVHSTFLQSIFGPVHPDNNQVFYARINNDNLLDLNKDVKTWNFRKVSEEEKTNFPNGCRL